MTVSAAFLIYSGIMPLIKTFAALLCGYVLVRMDMFPPAASRGASLISMNVALPALIFANIVPSFTPSNVSAMGPVVLIAMVYMLMGFVMGIIIRELCYVPRNFWQGIVIMTGMSNWGNLPNAIVMSVTKLPPFDPATDPALGVSYVSIFTVCYHIVFWMCGAASSLSWDYLPGVPQGEEAERRVSWKEKPIGRLVARMLRLSSPPPAPLPSELAVKDEEAFPSRDEKGSIETSEQSSVQSPRIVVVEEPQEENDVQLTSRISPLGMSNNQTRRLTIVIPPSPRRGSVPPTPMRPSVPPTPRFATAPSSPLRSVYPISPARSIAAITPIRTIHSIHSLEDPVAIAALIEQSAPPQHRSRIARFFAPFAALLKPVTISLAISLPIALITPLKALFVDATAQGGPHWHGPDGRPPLAFVMDSAQFIDTIAVPLTLILLGASFARIQLPNPLSRLPIMAMLSVTLAKMVILPVIGVVVVEAMVRGRLIPEDAKAEKFVAMLLSGTPAAVNQMIVSSLYAPDGDVDTLSVSTSPETSLTAGLSFFAGVPPRAICLHVHRIRRTDSGRLAHAIGLRNFSSLICTAGLLQYVCDQPASHRLCLCIGSSVNYSSSLSPRILCFSHTSWDYRPPKLVAMARSNNRERRLLHVKSTLPLRMFSAGFVPMACMFKFGLSCNCLVLPSSPHHHQVLAQSNLPEPSYTGAFTAYVSVDIDAPIDKVWDVLADFTKYPEWNPFVRSQVIVDKSKKPLEDQTPAKGKYLLMETHIPPTMDDSVSSTEAFEQITHFDDVTRRMAWKNLLPSWLIKAERWQVLSTTEDGKTRYESREVFGSIGAYLIKWFLSTNLMKSFNAMGDALKARSEQQ